MRFRRNYVWRVLRSLEGVRGDGDGQCGGERMVRPDGAGSAPRRPGLLVAVKPLSGSGAPVSPDFQLCTFPAQLKLSQVRRPSPPSQTLLVKLQLIRGKPRWF